MVMLCSGMAAFAEGEFMDDAPQLMFFGAGMEEEEDQIQFQPGTQITVAATTEMAGYFATDMWGNNTSDMDVRTLLHGYPTIAWVRALVMAPDDTTVDDIQIDDDLPDGSLRYTFSLNQELVYNDGSPITAKDYLFSLLLSSSPYITELGGMSRDLDHIIGCTEYMNATTDVVSGLRLIDDYTFSIQIRPDSLPYFHTLSMMSVTPYPMSVIAPECDVMDDGEGIYISGEFTLELLRETLLNPETGYIFNPRVTSGPYQLESYDAQNHIASFIVNENYLGNFEGHMPYVERIVFQSLPNEEMAERMASGDVDIVHKVVDRQAYLDLSSLAQSGSISRPRNYLRSGFGYLSFACEEGPTASVAVRNAIAQCINKESFIRDTFVEDTAMPVFGYYGMAQWMINSTVEGEGEAPDPSEFEDEDEMDNEIPVTNILEQASPSYSIAGAKSLLTSDGWTLNAKGENFAEGTDDVRYRQGADGLEALIIRWAKIKDSAIADSIEQTIIDPFAKLGIGLEITEMSLSEMLPYYYRQTERTYNMFNLASNFTHVFDPYYDFNTADEYQGWVNSTGLRDEQLMNLALDMRQTESWDSDTYFIKWLAFQERWIEMMPMVPLYSNVYFDFVANGIEDYEIEDISSWAAAIPYVHFPEAPVE